MKRFASTPERIENRVGTEFFDAASEVVMKRILTLVLFGSLTASLLTAQARRAPTQFSSPVLDEVARLSAGGASDATILAFLHARRARLESAPSADDLIRLKQIGVSEKVIEYLAGISSSPDRGRERRRAVRSDDASDDGSDVVAYDSPGGYYGRPYSSYLFVGGFYSLFFYPGFVIRGGGFGRGHFHGRRFR
jgi:hypothetical protein